MDALLYIVLVLGLGIYRIYFPAKNVTEVSNSTVIDHEVVEDELPIGSNLALKREPDAFTFILKELGLRKC